MSKKAVANTQGQMMKTYILELHNGSMRRVTVPANWKLTFGPTVPARSNNTGRGFDHGNAVWSLRFYEGAKENLRAIFTDVLSFRDESIVIVERRTTTQQKVTRKKTAQGVKDVLIEARATEWVNPDAPDDGGNPFLLETGEGEDDVGF